MFRKLCLTCFMFFWPVGTCKMCILCSVLVALEAVEVIHMSDLYSFCKDTYT